MQLDRKLRKGELNIMKIHKASISPWKGRKATISFYVRPKDRNREIPMWNKKKED